MSVSSTPQSIYPGRPRGGLTIVPNRVIGLVSYTDPIRTRGFTRCPVCTLFRRNRLLRPSPRSLLLLAWRVHLSHHYNRTSTTKQQLACAIPWVAVLSEQSVSSSLAQEPLSRTATWRPDCRPVSSLFQQCRPLPSGKRTLQSNKHPSALSHSVEKRNLCVL